MRILSVHCCDTADLTFGTRRSSKGVLARACTCLQFQRLNAKATAWLLQPQRVVLQGLLAGVAQAHGSQNGKLSKQRKDSRIAGALKVRLFQLHFPCGHVSGLFLGCSIPIARVE